MVFIISVNVLFLSNSQQKGNALSPCSGVYHKCQCPLFKQFTTSVPASEHNRMVFIISVNVLFLSNSQLIGGGYCSGFGVYHKCQCPLFKQFTTIDNNKLICHLVFIISVNVLFLSNSQRPSTASSTSRWCLS